MTLQQLMRMAQQVFGVRAGQAKTVALGWRDNWNALFVARQNAPITEPEKYALKQACFRAIGRIPEIVDARAYAADDRDRSWIADGPSRASGHAEMLVLSAMLRFRAARAIEKRDDAVRRGVVTPKYSDQYLADRQRACLIVPELRRKFAVVGRKARILANIEVCQFCWNLLDDLGIERGGLWKGSTDVFPVLNEGRGDPPLTGWWNPLLDRGYSHGAEGWAITVPGDYPGSPALYTRSRTSSPAMVAAPAAAASSGGATSSPAVPDPAVAWAVAVAASAYSRKRSLTAAASFLPLPAATTPPAAPVNRLVLPGARRPAAAAPAAWHPGASSMAHLSTTTTMGPLPLPLPAAAASSSAPESAAEFVRRGEAAAAAAIAAGPPPKIARTVASDPHESKRMPGFDRD